MRGERLEEGSERVGKIAFYSSKPGWKKSGKFLVEGPQAVREAIRSGLAKDVYFDESLPIEKQLEQKYEKTYPYAYVIFNLIVLIF